MRTALSTHLSCPRAQGQGSSLVSVIVTSCGKDELLAECLASIARQTHRNFECRVFLNRADTASAAKWEALYPSFIFTGSSENALYCRTQNEGIARSRGDFVLCLNDDVRLAPDFIAEALKAAQGDPAIGAVNGCVLRKDGVTVDSLGLSWQLSRKPGDRGYGRPKESQDMSPGFIFGANGAAAFYRRKMLDDIRLDGEYFDEDFGIYYEDFDLAWRAQAAGWKAFFCPAAVATHFRGASTRLENPRRRFLGRFALANIPRDLKVRHIRNRYATIIKNDDLSRFLLGLPWILFYEARLWMYLLFFEPRVLFEAFRDLRFVRSALAKRKKILKANRLHGH